MAGKKTTKKVAGKTVKAKTVKAKKAPAKKAPIVEEDENEDGGESSGGIAGKKVMFTGKLAAMTRDEAKSYVEDAGGIAAGSVSKDLDYLVIGDDGSFLYGAGTKGEKTLKAEKLIASGCDIKIISEKDFLAMVNAPAAAAPKEKVKVGPKKETAAPDGEAFDPTGKKFMFTGKLAGMSRSEAQARVTSIGGVNAGSVSKDLDYLVVGDSGSPLFGAGAKGDKILSAEKLQASGFPVKIIAESAFMQMEAGGGAGAAASSPKKKKK